MLANYGHFLKTAAATTNAHFRHFSTSQKVFSDEVLTEVKHSVQWIRLNRPQAYNAMNAEAYNGVIEALNSGQRNETVKLTVLTGTGPYFSSGNDLTNQETTMARLNCNAATAAEANHALVERFINCFIDYPKPLIAAVNGPAYGIMVTTLALCDYLIASQGATFTTPFSTLGVSPEGTSSALFPAILGPFLASKMLLFSETLSASRAHQSGFIAQVVPADEAIDSYVEHWLYNEETGIVHNCFTASMMEAKGLMRNGLERKRLREINRREMETLRRVYARGNAQKAIEKFKSKKAAKKEGK